jgi:hypothetical protein
MLRSWLLWPRVLRMRSTRRCHPGDRRPRGTGSGLWPGGSSGRPCVRPRRCGVCSLCTSCRGMSWLCPCCGRMSGLCTRRGRMSWLRTSRSGMPRLSTWRRRMSRLGARALRVRSGRHLRRMGARLHRRCRNPRGGRPRHGLALGRGHLRWRARPRRHRRHRLRLPWRDGHLSRRPWGSRGSLRRRGCHRSTRGCRCSGMPRGGLRRVHSRHRRGARTLRLSGVRRRACGSSGQHWRRSPRGRGR